MSDNNRGRKDFSSLPDGFSAEPNLGQKKPGTFSRFGATAEPGTFVVAQKNRENLVTSSVQKNTEISSSFKNTLQGTRPGMEIGPNSKALKALESITEGLDKAGITVESDGQISFNEDSWVFKQLEEEKKAYAERVAHLVRRFALLKRSFDAVSSFATEEQRKEIETLLSGPLAWLKNDDLPEKISDEEEKVLGVALSSLSKITSRIEDEQDDALRKTQEAERLAQEAKLLAQRQELIARKALGDLYVTFGTLQAKAILLGKGYEDRLLPFLDHSINTRLIAETTPNDETVAGFKAALNELDEEIGNIEKEKQDEETKTKAEPTPVTPVSAAPTPEKAPANIYGGWPTSIKQVTKKEDPKNPKSRQVTFWQLTDRNNQTKALDHGETWSSLKTNFDEEFKHYLAFIQEGDRVRKIKECGNLIAHKEAVIKAILDLDIDTAFSLIAVFRDLIAETKTSWTEKMKKEGEVGAKDKEGLEKKKAIVKSFEEVSKRYAKEKERYQNEALPFITSELERQMFDRSMKTIDGYTKELEEEELEEYVSNVATFTALVETTKQRLEKMYGKGNAPLRTRFGKKGVGHVFLRGGKSITEDEWNKKQEQDEAEKEITIEKQKRATREELERIHRKMLERDKASYISFYKNKPRIAGDQNKDIAQTVLEEERARLGEEQLGLAVDRAELVATGAYDETTQKEIEEITKSIHDLDVAIDDATPKTDEELQRDELRALTKNETTIKNTKQTFNPSRSTLLRNTGKEKPSFSLLRPFKSWGDIVKYKEGEKAYTANKEKVTGVYEEDANKAQVTVGPRKEEDSVVREVGSAPITTIPTKDSLDTMPHTSNPRADGMVQQFTTKKGEAEAQLEPMAKEASTIKIEPTFSLNDLDTTVLEARNGRHEINDSLDAQRLEREANDKKKFASVEKTLQSFSGESWLRMLALFTALQKPLPKISEAEVARTFTQSQKSAESLADINWKRFLTAEELAFTEKLVGKMAVSFNDLVREEAPSVLEKRLFDIPSMNIKKLTGGEEVVYGLLSEERRALCLFAEKLKNSITKAKGLKTAYVYAENETLQSLYDVARNAIGTTDNKK